jgi:nucleotide-binding universal stress UspA family protein
MPDAIIGSTAERVATLARRPVLLVRNRAGHPYERVIIAADIDSDVRPSLDVARFVAPEAELSILHAYEDLHETALMLHGATSASLRGYRAQARRDARARLTERLVEAGVDPGSLVLRHGHPRHVLQREQQRTRHAVLVLSRGRSIARHVLLGSVCRSVVANGRADVLLV